MPYRRPPRWSDLSHPQRLLVLFFLSCILSTCAWLGYGFFGREHQSGNVVQVTWYWHVDVVRWDKRHYHDTTSSHPSSCRNSGECGGTYNTSSWEESYTVSTTSTDSKGNVTIKNETRWETHYRYDHDEWVPQRTYSRSGHDKAPKAPEYHLDQAPPTNARRSRPDEVGSVRRPYTVLVECEDGKGRTLETESFTEWSVWDKGDVCDVVLTGFGSVVELRPLKVEVE